MTRRRQGGHSIIVPSQGNFGHGTMIERPQGTFQAGHQSGTVAVLSSSLARGVAAGGDQCYSTDVAGEFDSEAY